ncbi:MAG: hypothetical protein AB4038_20795 [Prochloraceae cyanobacterium]
MKFSVLGLLAAISWLGMECQLVRGELLLSRNTSLECPADLESLTSVMLKDLPNYANRVIHRSRPLNRNLKPSEYVIVAGRPEFEPLPLTNSQYDPVFQKSSDQIFFTTLERHYLRGKIVERQNYHWLFLSQTSSGWKLVTIFSRWGFSSNNKQPLPPRETSNGFIGEALRLWLRDCRLGVLRSIKN